MKRFTFLALTAALLVVLMTGCGSDTSNRYNGNVSTTDDGKVNGTNENMTGEFVGENGFTGSENNNNNNNQNTSGSNGTNGDSNTNGTTGSSDNDWNNDSNSGMNDAADRGTNDGLDSRGRNRSRSGWTSGTGRAASGETGHQTFPQ